MNVTDEAIIQWLRDRAADTVTANGSRATFVSDLYFEIADRLEKRRWRPMSEARKDGTFYILLARLFCTEAGCEHPIIGSFHDGAWWAASYLGEGYHRLTPIAFMERPDFEFERLLFSKSAAVHPCGVAKRDRT